MTTYLDTNDKALADRLGAALNLPVREGHPLNTPLDPPYNNIDNYVIYGEDLFDTSLPTYRMFHVMGAREGHSYFSDKLEAKSSPMYRGRIEKDKHFQQMALAAQYSLTRASAFYTEGVVYLGKVYTDPKYVLVLDNTKYWITNATDFLNELTDDFWGSVGFVVTKNAEHFVGFFEEYCYTVPLAISDGACAKLRHVNVEYCKIPAPGALRSYGVTVRELAGRRSRELYLEDQSPV